MAFAEIFFLKTWLQGKFNEVLEAVGDIDPVSGGGGSNPTGGQVDVAIQNHFNSALELLRAIKAGTLTAQGLYRLYADGHSATLLTGVNSVYNSGSRFYRSTSKLDGLFHFDGSGTVLTTNQNANVTYGAFSIDTNNASTQYDVTNFKFGTSSLKLVGASNQFLNVSPTTPGSQDFTLNAWVRFDSMAATQCLLAVGNNKSLAFRLTTTTMDLQFSTDGSNYTTLTSNALSWNTGQWYHLEWVRSGTTIYFFVDGVGVGTGTIGAVTVSSQVGGKMGRSNNGSNEQFDGNIDELAWRIGEALHTSNFTPPVAATTDLEINSITLTSPAIVTDASPSNIHVMLAIDDLTFGDTITVNTDLIVSLSRDNGANYQAVTMQKWGTWQPSNNQTLYGGVIDTFSIPAGTNLKYKIQTANSKRMFFYGDALAWF